MSARQPRIRRTSFTTSLAELESGLADSVKLIVQPLFMIFDFFEISDEILDQIVDGFVAGNVV